MRADQPMPDDMSAYRVFNRKTFVVIMAVLLSVVAASVRTGLDHLVAYMKKIEGLAAANPTEAAATLTLFCWPHLDRQS